MGYSVSPSDIEARWRPLTSDELTIATTLIDDATLIVDSRLPGLAAAVTAETVSADLVVAVIARMVIAALQNPNGYESETIGAYTYRRNRDGSSWLAEYDYDLLVSALGSGSEGAFTITPYGAPDTLTASFE